MIPKIIHYCWVGNAPKPKSVLYCIESWKKFCPDYEIREWNESNYDFTKNKYMKQAYEAKKWGFVPDYARLDIIYEYGGIYLDTDVEIIRSFDELLDQEAFMGFEETGEKTYYVNCGQGFGAVPHHEIIKKARDLYEHVSFYKEDGTLNMLASPHYTTQTLRQFGLVQKNYQQDLKKIKIYPTDFFCPKNFRTGKLIITQNTFSIHHFTASWLEDKIKKELEYQQKLETKYGESSARKIMYLQSVLRKYSSLRMIIKIPRAVFRKLKIQIVRRIEDYPYNKGLKIARKSVSGNKTCVILDTSIDSDNLGDQIIMENCEKQLRELVNIDDMIRVPTHRFLKEQEKRELKQAAYKVLCGTNLLSGNMRSYGLWKLSADVAPYINTVLMGVGMASGYEKIDRYTKKLFQTIFSEKYIHSVRDSYTENILTQVGIKNVINTGCPTMWELTPEHCAMIPRTKSKNVVCTLTDYCRDEKMDQKMVKILCDNYEKVYIWVQGTQDMEYINSLQIEQDVIVIPRELVKYDEVLRQKDLDYVGTRLHAGIRALAFGHRGIIISIDNRAESISLDTNLPILKREDIDIYLEEFINSSFETDIHLPIDNIRKWKAQFRS